MSAINYLFLLNQYKTRSQNDFNTISKLQKDIAEHTKTVESVNSNCSVLELKLITKEKYIELTEQNMQFLQNKIKRQKNTIQTYNSLKSENTKLIAKIKEQNSLISNLKESLIEKENELENLHLISSASLSTLKENELMTAKNLELNKLSESKLLLESKRSDQPDNITYLPHEAVDKTQNKGETNILFRKGIKLGVFNQKSKALKNLNEISGKRLSQRKLKSIDELQANIHSKTCNDFIIYRI